MNKQINYVFVSCFFLLVSLVFIQHYHYLNSSHATILVPITIFLILFTDIVILMSKDTKSALFFGKIIFLVALYFVLALVPLTYRSIIMAAIISFLPHLLYRFYVLFSRLESSKKAKNYSYFSLTCSILSMILLVVDFTEFYWIVLLNILVSIFCCGFLYINEKKHLSLKTRNELSVLVKAFGVAFTPFILAYSIFLHVWSETVLLYSLFFILILPITIGIILV